MDFFMSAVSELPSADLDARWLKKGGSCHFVCKVFVRTDEEGFLDRVLACPATRARHPRFSAMVAGCEARSQFRGRRAVEVETALKAMELDLLKAVSWIKLVAPEGRSLSETCPVRRIGG